VWVFDHLLYRDGGEESGIHGCWTILAAVGEATQRVALGTIVLCTAFRNAALRAKMAATLDHLGGGRLILGSVRAGSTRRVAHGRSWQERALPDRAGV
jgi:alkanesulfonate monooxygenase SsuD/methylene tetrahydromethanopterin reductase-like flavin-dependent oxidoreductase (luciferase family)